MSTHDLVVIGAGPAGLAAATQARALGLDVALVDEQAEPGGQIYRGVERAHEQGRAAGLGEDYLRGLDLVRAFRASGATYMPGHHVWQVDPDGRAYASDGSATRELSGRKVLVAVGAMERPVPIRGWTLPGVMTVGAAQIVLKTAGMLPGDDVWIAGSGPLALYYAAQVAAAGGRVAGILDTTRPEARTAARAHWRGALSGWRYLAKGYGFLSSLRRSGITRFEGVEEVEALGEGKLARIRWRVGGVWSEALAKGLLLHEGVVPNVQMTLAIGCAHEWDALQQAFRPRTDAFGATDLPGIHVAGDCGGIAGARLAELRGREVALGIAAQLGKLSGAERDRRVGAVRGEMRAHAGIRPFLDTMFAPRPELASPPDDVVACRCEIVTAGRIREAVKLGCLGPNQAKSFTRCGMGPCQGRLCGLTVTGTIAQARGVSPAEVGPYRIRPPLKPLRLGELAALAEEAASE